MTKVSFTAFRGRIISFELKGHSGFADENDIVCAAVSSAAYMTANTITDVYKLNADIELDEEEGLLSLSMAAEDAEKCRELLSGFEMHINALAAQYPNNIECRTTTIN